MKPLYTFMFGLSVLVLAAAIAALATWGLPLGTDFTGGSVMESEFLKGRPETQLVREALASVPGIGELSVSEAGERNLVIRMGPLSQAQHEAVLKKLTDQFPSAEPREVRFDSIGPAIGQELKGDSIKAILLLLVAVLGYIAYMFRTLKRSLSLWGMAAGTVLGLAHDIIIPLGLFAWLGRSGGVQMSAVFVAAILTILGYTVSDKVVIYDRVRENILRGSKKPLADTVHESVMQTLVRSINNTLTVMLSSLAIFLFGGDSIRYFALALMVGIGLGAYSSIFVAAPVLVWLSGRRG